MKNKTLLLFVLIFSSIIVYLPFVSVGITNVLGLVGATLFFWQIILGTRYILNFFSYDLVRRNNIHKQLGKLSAVFILTHPLISLFEYGFSFWDFVKFQIPQTNYDKFILLGRGAFYIFIIIWFSSVFLRKRIKYRQWLYLHYLSYPMIVFVFLRGREIGSIINSIFLVEVYFNLIFIGVVISILLRISFWLNIGKVVGRVVSISSGYGDIVLCEILVENKSFFDIKSGQFFYLRNSFFGEAHPYSIYRIDGRKIVFAIKKVGPHSIRVGNLKVGNKVYLDGPYGVFTSKGVNNISKIIFAGGIGVTPFYEFVRKYNKNTYMFYSNRNIKSAVGRNFFKKVLGERYVDVLSKERISKQNIEYGRIDLGKIIKYIKTDLIRRSSIYICGSEEYTNTVISILKKIGVEKENIMIEQFSL